MLSTLLLAFFTALPSAHAYLGDSLFLPPHADYHQLESEHFVVVYPQAYEREARDTARYAEDVHSVLTHAFKFTPDHKCHLILTDNEDFANGVTSPVGHQGIVLYLIPPDPYSSIGEYDNWLRHLIMHEYAHYVTLTQARGIFDFGQYIFGELLYPNAAWPIWISEGMAVYAESEFTREGRGHGTYYSTLTRDAIAHHVLGTSAFLLFDQLTGPRPDYPFGEMPYYAGFAMIDEMIVKHGADAAARFAEESSWRFPWFNDGTLGNISRRGAPDEDTTFEGLWASWIARETQTMGPDIAWLAKHGAPEPRLLSPAGTAATGSRLSPDGKKIAYAESSGHERPSLYVQTLGPDAAASPRTRIEDAVAGAGFAWSADGRHVYYSKSDYNGPYALYSDLFEWDVEHGSTRRLTHGARAKDPDSCAPNTLVFATQRGHVSELRALDLGTGAIRLLYTAPNDHHVANARCSRDGKTVVFSEHGTEANDAMMALDLGKPGPARLLFGGPTMGFAALFPEPAANGDVYFTRAANNYYDLARWDAATKKIRLVARSTGGYWLPSLARDRRNLMTTTYLAASGVRVAVIDPVALEAASNDTANRPDNKHDPEPRVAAEISHAPERLSPKVETSAPTGYSLLSSLQPRIWAPYIQLDSNEDQFGAEVLGWDDLDQFEYTLLAWYDTIPRKPEGILSTFHRLGTFRLGLGVASQVSAYAVTTSNLREYDEDRKFTVSLSRPLPGIFETITPTASASWERVYQGGDFGTYVFQPDESVGLELTYDNRATYNYSLTKESGILLDVNGRRYFSNPGQAWKGLVTANPVVPLFPSHSNLSVNAMFGVAPNTTDAIFESYLRVGGHGTAGDLDPPLRGYPLGNFAVRRAAIVQAEYRIPVGQIFRGYNTWPLFLNNFGVYGFFDGARLQQAAGPFSPLIDASGGGLLINATGAYAIGAQIRLEFAHGFQQQLNGQNVFSASLQF